MSDKFEKYNQKRNFDRTREPAGQNAKTGSQLRFVVQHHLASRDHFDFRLEYGGALLSWAVPKGPSYNPADKRLAVRVEDHPLGYRNFEGTIPKGEYGGGTVMIWDEGVWEPQTDAAKGLEDGSLKIIMYGERLKGKWALIRTAKTGKPEDSWLLIKEKDEYAKTGAGIEQFDKSIRSGRSMEEIASGKEGVKNPRINRINKSVKTGNTAEEKEKEETGRKEKSTEAKKREEKKEKSREKEKEEKETGGKEKSGKKGKEEKESFKKNPFSETGAQLASLENALPQNGEWLFELKYDGYRILSYTEGGIARLVSRNGNDYTKQFHEIADALKEWAGKRAMVLDGEAVITDQNGKTDFQALQNYLRKTQGEKLSYIVFDLLALDGEDLRGRPLTERKERLKKLMEDAPGNLYFSGYSESFEDKMFRSVCDGGFEGIVAKRADSVYSGTRNGDWIKLKCISRQEFVIGGYTRTEKKSSGVSALLLGVYEGGDLIYAGRAGTGITEAASKELEKRFGSIIRKTPPFKGRAETKNNETVIWLKAEIAAEIQFSEWTRENLLRHASFKGLRADKKIKDIIKEGTVTPVKNEKKENIAPDAGVIIEGIKITSPDKHLYTNPEITKREIAEYYQRAAKRMFPFVRGRILSLVTCPKGVAEPCFFKKHLSSAGVGIKAVPVTGSGGGKEEYFYIDDIPGIIYKVQMNTLEFHIWGSRADKLDNPDMMVFDLDPDEGMSLEKIRQGVMDLKSILDGLKLNSFLKTSGGKGYHIVVPFDPWPDWETFRNFAKNTAEAMEQKWPDRYTSNIRKKSREGKIFIDWLRNTRGATSIAPYSVRAREGAKVSMPIAWDELDKIAPDGVNIQDALKRLKARDPWADFPGL